MRGGVQFHLIECFGGGGRHVRLIGRGQVGWLSWLSENWDTLGNIGRSKGERIW